MTNPEAKIKNSLPENPFVGIALTAILERLVQIQKHSKPPFKAVFDSREIAPKGVYINRKDARQAIRFIEYQHIAIVKSFVFKKLVDIPLGAFKFSVDVEKLLPIFRHIAPLILKGKRLSDDKLPIVILYRVSSDRVVFTREDDPGKRVSFKKLRGDIVNCILGRLGKKKDPISSRTIAEELNIPDSRSVNTAVGKMKPIARRKLGLGDVNLIEGVYQEGYILNPNFSFKKE